MCLFEKPHPYSSEIFTSVSHCPDISSEQRQRQKQNQAYQLEKKNSSLGALRLEIDPHPASHDYDTQDKIRTMKNVWVFFFWMFNLYSKFVRRNNDEKWCVCLLSLYP